MNLLNRQNDSKSWNKASVAGVGLTGIGLVCAILVIGQLAPSLLNGHPPQVSSTKMGIEIAFTMLSLMVGFTFMVIGADPFDDSAIERHNEDD